MGLLVVGLLLMPTVCGYTWPVDLDTIIREEAVRAGVPLDLAYALIAAESSFDPSQVTPEAPGGYSYGLLQLYDHGQGAGYPKEVLLDPRSNLQIGLPYISSAFTATWSPTILPYEFIWLVSVRSGHPGDVPRNDYRIKRIAQIWGCFFPAAGISGPGGAPATATAPGPAVALAGGMTPLIAQLYFPGGLLRGITAVMSQGALTRIGGGALSPGGIARRLQGQLLPRSLLPGAGQIFLARPRTRLPPRHRFPRRLR